MSTTPKSDWLRGNVLGLAAIFLAAFVGANVGTASAAMVGIERPSANSPSNSSDKGVTVTCPPGKRLTGGGGEIVGGGDGVALNDVIPNPELTAVTINGVEEQAGFATNWTVRGLALCAIPPPGLERIVATSPNDSANKTVTATCPAGKRLLGAGGEVSGGGGEVVLEDVRVPNLTSVTVQGIEDEDGTAVDWLLRAYAICANPVAGLERVVGTSPTDSVEKSIRPACPEGKRLVGAGAEITGGGGQVTLEEIVPIGIPPTALQAKGQEDTNGTASNWSVRAIAICAAASERIVAQSPNDSEFFKTVNADCPTGMQITGGGGDITGGAGQVVLDEITPATVGSFFTAFEDETGFAGNWFLRAYAICATPLPGVQRVFVSSPTDSSDKSVTATCPAGRRLVGAGGELAGNTGQVVLEDIVPNPGLTSVRVTGVEDETGTDETWAVFARAICANAPPGLELVTAAGEPDSDLAGVTAACPAGKNLLGIGAEIEGGDGQVVLDDVRPNALLTTNTVTAFEDETGFGLAWFPRAYAICANP
jgi:hypothetical protein